MSLFHKMKTARERLDENVWDVQVGGDINKRVSDLEDSAYADSITLPSGKSIYAACGYIGINKDLSISSGYDDRIWIQRDYGDSSLDVLSIAEIIELCDYAIVRWSALKEKMIAESGGGDVDRLAPNPNRIDQPFDCIGKSEKDAFNWIRGLPGAVCACDQCRLHNRQAQEKADDEYRKAGI